ncbi:FMRFamide receptor-like [Eriocheir sinensis]|uniref:FMRFamide receptor-like n=1 Tax=Eriocheir sinensis TaxID=95602 RepID=UPI0021CABB87|nr:FMRFamide receptor-like [Eriocheir sinensis]
MSFINETDVSDSVDDYDLSSNRTIPDMVDEMCLQTYNSVNATMPAPKLMRFVVYGVLLTSVGLLGLAGNFISITILSRPKMQSSINCCLIGLTSFDMIVTTTSILMFGLPEICEYTQTMVWYTQGIYQLITPIIFPLALIAQTGSVYLTVTVTIERYIAVCRPLRARLLCTYGRAKVYVMCVAIFSIVYNLPRFWEVSTKECIISKDESMRIVIPTVLRRNPFYIEIYIMWLYLLVMYLVPFLCLMIFNFFIYREVRAANHERQQLSRLQRKEIGLAVMLLVVVSVFFVCNVLAFIINILELMAIVVEELTMTSNLLVTINSSVNFIIYCIFGQKFRKLLLQMFCSSLLPRVARDAAMESAVFRNNSIYGESRTFTNGKTQTFRLSSWNGAHNQGRVLQPHPNRGHHGFCGQSWRTSRYSSVPVGENAAPSSAPSLFTATRNQSLLPQRSPTENVQVL